MAVIFGKCINFALVQVPTPRDLELPLPLGEYELKVLLVILFLAHILFVNLMIGGTLFSVIFEIIGRHIPRYDALARRISHTITVNKSLAVVLGVGPLLCINLVYTLHFYSANALTGYAWLMIIPLVTLAFLLAYLHKYTWDRWIDSAKQLHIFVGLTATFLFLCIPLIFLSNINLMLFPEKWADVGGFFSSLQVGNVFPRYFHFLAASLAISALFLAGWFGRKRYPLEQNLPRFERPEIKRLFYRMAFYITLAQLVLGPLLLFTLPYRGISLELIVIILLGVSIAIIVLFLLRREFSTNNQSVGKYYLPICLLLGAVVLAMATGRHIYRENSLAGHLALIDNETARFRSIEVAARMRLDAGLSAGEAVETGPTGRSVYKNCAACHAVDRVLAGPSLKEVYAIYKDNPDGIVSWAKNPGKKRPEFAPMPSFAHLGDEKLRLVADYILQLAGSDEQGKKGA